QPFRDRAADERADRDGAADGRSPERDRRAALTSLELLPDERERGREQAGAADALQPAREVEEQRRRGDATEQRREGEDGDARDEYALAPEVVGQRAAREEEHRQRQRVRVDHPLEARKVRVQVAVDARERYLDDGYIHEQHERAAED